MLLGNGLGLLGKAAHALTAGLAAGPPVLLGQRKAPTARSRALYTVENALWLRYQRCRIPSSERLLPNQRQLAQGYKSAQRMF